MAEHLEAFGEGSALAQRGADLCLGGGQLLAAGEQRLDVCRGHGMLAIVIENNVGSASTVGRAQGNRLRTGEGAQMINWPEAFCGDLVHRTDTSTASA
ncbi:MAG: hypothetical protein QOG76_5494 [Pseudonocardiales bacterium]|nr:hypothetical protein [Pseudonocardiales bacterium]